MYYDNNYVNANVVVFCLLFLLGIKFIVMESNHPWVKWFSEERFGFIPPPSTGSTWYFAVYEILKRLGKLTVDIESMEDLRCLVLGVIVSYMNNNSNSISVNIKEILHRILYLISYVVVCCLFVCRRLIWAMN